MQMRKNQIICIIIIVLAFMLSGCKSSDYKKAVLAFESADYAQAESLFNNLKGYKDSDTYLADIPYQEAVTKYEAGDYEAAKKAFSELGDYKDSIEYLEDIPYQEAVFKFESGDYEAAKKSFAVLGDYKDSGLYIKKIIYKEALLLFEDGKWASARDLFHEIEDYGDVPDYLARIEKNIKNETILKAAANFDRKDYFSCVRLLNELEDCEEAKPLLEKAVPLLYEKAVSQFNDQQFESASRAFSEIREYEDSDDYFRRANENIERDKMIKERVLKSCSGGDIEDKLKSHIGYKSLQYYIAGKQLGSNTNTLKSYIYDEEIDEFAVVIDMFYYRLFEFAGSLYKDSNNVNAYVVGNYDREAKSISYQSISIDYGGRYNTWIEEYESKTANSNVDDATNEENTKSPEGYNDKDTSKSDPEPHSSNWGAKTDW